MVSSVGDTSSRNELVELLRSVAALEHQVMCEYLFAAFSLKNSISEDGLSFVQLEQVREWKGTILLVARQEMEHLGIVSNLLSALGDTPYFGWRAVTSRRPHLRPLSTESLTHFVAIEESHDRRMPAGTENVDGCYMIGELYGRIREGFANLDSAVDEPLFGLPETQVTNATIDLRPNLYNMNLLAVSDKTSAGIALDHILDSSHGDELSHAERFRQILEEYTSLTESDPGFRPVRNVAPNPVYSLPAAGSDATSLTPVEERNTRGLLKLFNDAYELMLIILKRFYSPSYESYTERAALKRLAFFPLMTMLIRPIGEMLTLMPIAPRSELVAGPGFEFSEPIESHPERRTAWLAVHGRLRQLVDQAKDLTQRLQASDDTRQREVGVRLAFVRDNLTSLCDQFERRMHLKAEYVQQLLRKAF